ncbi:MAG TPA: spore coat protein U domain-containing protein [Casimicrobiaceae bacterium]
MKRFIPALRRHAPRGILALALLAFAASAEAVHTCTVGIGNLSFGAYTGTQTTSSATMTITCTLSSGLVDNIAFTATLSTGAGSYTQRLLTHVGAPPDTLPYNLYLGSVPGILNTSVWGDGSGATITASGTMQLIVIFAPSRTQTYTVAGAMAAVATLPTAGTYQDLVNGTVTYN